MSKLFNITSAGSFADNTTFSRPMLTVGSVVETGADILPVTIIRTYGVAGTEASTIKGVFLHINKVKPNANSVFDIILETDISTHTFSYHVSALQDGITTGQDYPLSRYWQGFDLLDTDLSAATSFELKLFCSSSEDVTLIGDKTSFNVNRYFVVNAAGLVSSTPTPEIRIGSYLKPYRVVHPLGTTDLAGNLPPATIECDTTVDTTDIVIWNGATLHLKSGSTISSNSVEGILVSVGGGLSASPGSNIILNGGGSITGLDRASISLSGTEKTPYTHLDVEQPAGTTTFTTTQDIVEWKVDDKITITGNLLPFTTEQKNIIAINNIRSFDIDIPTSNSHLAVNSALVNVHGNFRGAPVINSSRDTCITSTLPASIKVENSCSLSLNNVQLSGLGGGRNPSFQAAVNLYNNNYTVIDKCAIFGGVGAGVFIDTLKALNFNINNSTICNKSHGIIQGNRPPIINSVIVSTVSGNAIVNNTEGILTNYTDNIIYDNNIVSHNTQNGITLNKHNVTITANKNCVVKQFSNNIMFANIVGLLIGDVTGKPIANTICIGNRSHGVLYSPTIFNDITLFQGVSSSHNTATGITFHGISVGSSLTATSINTQSNKDIGVLLENVYGVLSGVTAINNVNESMFVLNCNKGILNIHDVFIDNNGRSLAYNYPDLGGFNFHPTYLINGQINQGLLDNTCITLLNTKAERFVVEGITFNSLGPNITLTPTTLSFIEGSYIFSDCAFSDTPFDVLSKYQTDIFSETGFVSMYQNGDPKSHFKYTPAGLVCSDTEVYKDSNIKISEKLTPNSTDLKLRSSKKIIFIDNFDNSIPPSLAPEFLHASVWVKKDSAWGSNSHPRLMVATNPTLSINQDTVISEHTANTTDWVQLTSLTPIASAIETRGPIELYVDCSGQSGGSINVDSWDYTIFRM